MVINIGTLFKIGGSALAFVLLLYIGATGFKQNSKQHGKGSTGNNSTSNNNSTDSTK